MPSPADSSAACNDMLIVGHVTHDRYGDRLRAGGCAFYGGLVHRALGAEVELATVVGEDFACADELTPLLKAGAVPRGGAETTLFSNVYPPNGVRVQTLEAVADRVSPKAVSSRPRDVLHLAPVLHEVDLQAWVAHVPARWVGINVQGWTRALAQSPGRSAGPVRVQTRPWQITPDALRGVHLACLSDEDLVGQGDLLHRLRQGVDVVALTHGKAGCDVFVGDMVVRVGVYATQQVDPTGAGDTFAAAFLHALARGNNHLDAACLASAAASVVIEAEGASALGRLAELAGPRSAEVMRATLLDRGVSSNEVSQLR